MLLTNVALILFAEGPFKTVVLLEKTVFLRGVVSYPLVEYELRIINDPADHELVNLVVINSAYALRYLGGVDGF